MRRKRIWQVGVLSLVLVAVAPAAAPAADPVYVQYACHLPSGEPAPVDGFVASEASGLVAENTCETGGGLEIRALGGPVTTPAIARWTYSPPPGVTLVAASLTRTARNISAPGASSNRSANVTMGDEALDHCGMAKECAETLNVSGTGDAPFALTVACLVSPCDGPQPGPGLWSADHLELTLRDTTTPSFDAPPSGDLLESGVVSGTRTITWAASDVGGGLFKSALIIDGVEHPAPSNANAGSCSKPFTRSVPCPTSLAGAFTVDTQALKDGAHTVQVAVTDATEVNEALSPPVTINVRNESQESATLGDHATVAAVRLVGRAFEKRSVTGRYNRRLRIHGRVLADGRALGGVTLEIHSMPVVRNARRTLVARARTDAAGRFTVSLPPGPSRRVWVRLSGAETSLASLRLVVPAPIRLQASRDRLLNKQKLLLTAYLLRGEVPAGSADVAFQVRIGDQWRTFATRPLGPNGRARIGHRFRVTYHRMTYRFRAIVVRRRQFPYDNATSPAVAVRVN